MNAVDWIELRYEPVEHLGDPASGVRLARDRLASSTAPRVVIKEATLDPERTALMREVELSLAHEHTSLRRVVARGRNAEREVVVFEHIDGVDLAEHLSGKPNHARACAIDLLRVLGFLHERGLVHGDLKPENVVVEGASTRLIDLGLALELGALRRGGTPAFIPPEELVGAPASVAGDLWGVGAMFRATGAALEPRLERLVSSCLSDDPARRPASADGALAMVGAVPLPLDGRGELPRRGSHEAVSLIEGALSRLDGTTVLIQGSPGAGRTRLIRDSLRAARLRGQPLADVAFAESQDALAALATIFDVGVTSGAERAVSIAVAAAARSGLAIVVDDADVASTSRRSHWAVAAVTLTELGSGALVLVGADAELADLLVSVGAKHAVLDLLETEDVVALVEATMGRSDEVLGDAIRRAFNGRAGHCARAVQAASVRPEVGPTEVVSLLKNPERLPKAPAVVLTAVEARSAAAAALSTSAPGRAVEILDTAFPLLRRQPSMDVVAAELLARAEATRGRLDAAFGVVEAIGKGGRASAGLRLEAAGWLERLGRYEQAGFFGRELLDDDDPVIRAGGAAISALAFSGLGEPSIADEIAAEALAEGVLDSALECRLHCVRSDAALLRGDPEEAVEEALLARAAAERSGDAVLLPMTLARAASGDALGRRPRRARDRYNAAYEAALAAGDIVGLPPYIINLATAEHALGELGSAIAHYQQAARLAEGLGRSAIRAAALVNWAGLLVDIGALDESREVLADARAAAAASGSAIYSAQAELVEAALLGRRDVTEGRRLACAARLAFDACGAARQSLEALLLDAELAIVAADSSPLRELIANHMDDLEQGGLGARATLAAARADLLEGDLDGALSQADRAAGLARDAGDGDLESRALGVLASVHGKLGTGAEGAIVLRAREGLGRVAAKLPAGLRERFLRDGERGELIGQVEAGVGRWGKSRVDPGPTRLLALVRRLLLEGSEARLLEAAVDEAIALSGAERAFLLLHRPGRSPTVALARNIGRTAILRGGAGTQYSRSVAERVLERGEQVVTTSAETDPRTQGARSVLDLGLRSILCVPIRGPSGVTAALSLDHRFETDRFGPETCELIQSLADVIGVALEQTRLRRDAEKTARELARANDRLAVENQRRGAEVDRLERLLESGGGPPETAPGGMVGQSRLLRAALEIARRVAPSTLPVVIEGESGTGKELLARYVHDQSDRAAGPFLALNCGAVPETLLESELFGHARGAFTGATRDHPGLFRAASGGTVLLDEIGEMSAHMQPRLLRVLQEGEVWPVGSDMPVTVDVRVVAATNRDLEHEVEVGRFRHDLYFRLLGVRLRVPPLRERIEDVPLLVRALLERITMEPGMRAVRLSRQATRELLRHRWPGNVRELEQTLRRAVLLAEGEVIQPADLGLADDQTTRREAIQSFDRGLVVRTLRAHGGNRTHAARALGISRSTLHRWIVRYQIE